jgi:peptide/nickel transport system ATP-binding protein
VSALDVSVQAQILNLLEDMKRQYGLTMVFISHDLSVVKHVSDRVAVMYLGRLCEVGDAESIYQRPAHPYTTALLSSIMTEGDGRAPEKMAGDMPSALKPPSGCRFRTRCPKATDICAEVAPPMVAIGPEQSVACHHPNVPVAVTRGPATSGPTTSGPTTSGPGASGAATSGPSTGSPNTGDPFSGDPGSSGPQQTGPSSGATQGRGPAA